RPRNRQRHGSACSLLRARAAASELAGLGPRVKSARHPRMAGRSGASQCPRAVGSRCPERTLAGGALRCDLSANTLHIMSWPEVEALFAALPTVTTADAKLAVYGPFNHDGKHTSASNAEFD